MQTERRIYRSDAERRALDQLRAGRWVRLVPPLGEGDDWEILAVDASGRAPGDEQGRG